MEYDAFLVLHRLALECTVQVWCELASAGVCCSYFVLHELVFEGAIRIWYCAK